MKALLVNGSPRREGNTSVALASCSGCGDYIACGLQARFFAVTEAMGVLRYR